MLKYSENPPVRHPAAVPLESLPKRWCVAHTKSRNEKVLANVLLSWDQPYFLPMVERVHVRRSRKVRSVLPLFPGYVFFTGDESTQYRVMTTNRVARIISVPDQNRLVQELKQLQRALDAGADLQPYPFLPQGTRCRITSGAFKGLEGVVQRTKGAAQLVLQVEALGQAVALEIDIAMVEKVSESSAD